MNFKRGQITIFVVVALVIVAGVVVYLVFRDATSGELSPENLDDAAIVVEKLKSCVSQIALESVKELSLQGGYLSVPEPRERFYPSYVPYYWADGESYIPEPDSIRSDFDFLLNDKFLPCLDSDFNGYSVAYARYNISSRPIDDGVLIFVDMPMRISRDNSSVTLEGFELKQSTRFYEAYSAARSVVEEQSKYPTMQPLGFVSNLAYKNKFNFDFLNLDDRSIVYSFYFNSSEEFFNFRFGIKSEVQNE